MVLQTQYLDNYFIDSSSNISCFFEEKAFDTEGKMLRPKEQCINKIGHGRPVYQTRGSLRMYSFLNHAFGI